MTTSGNIPEFEAVSFLLGNESDELSNGDDGSLERVFLTEADVPSAKSLTGADILAEIERVDPGAVKDLDASSITLRTGEALRRLRQARGWSQKELAQRAGLDPSVVSTIEAGKGKQGPTLATLNTLVVTAGGRISIEAAVPGADASTPVETQNLQRHMDDLIKEVQELKTLIAE